MSARVLHSRAQIRGARRELKRRGLSALTPAPLRTLERLGISLGRGTGDWIKSWDLLETLLFLEERLPHEAPILDIGAYQSEILVTLFRAGFGDLSGVDLNPKLKDSVDSTHVRLVCADFLDAPFADGAFAAVTAVSVIEHGFQRDRLLAEVSRLLRPGGYFLASFDYWPEKIDTSNIRLFDMDWCIFSRHEVLALLEAARGVDLVPVGELALDAEHAPVRFAGHRYTFAWIALRKR